MNPQQTQAEANGFKPKWRIFSPLTRVWLSNPFSHDVVFQVADEHNRPFKYCLPAGKVSELPGGAIATLGVKHVIDELIQNTEKDSARMWDAAVRAKHEARVILRVKETAPLTSNNPSGNIDLSVKSDAVDEPEQITQPEPEQAFPTLNQDKPAPGTGMSYQPKLDPLPDDAKSGLDSIVGASLPTKDALVEA